MDTHQGCGFTVLEMKTAGQGFVWSFSGVMLHTPVSQGVKS